MHPSLELRDEELNGAPTNLYDFQGDDRAVYPFTWSKGIMIVSFEKKH